MKQTILTIALLFLPLLSRAEDKPIDLRVTELEKRVETLEKMLASSKPTTPATTNQVKTDTAAPLELASWDYLVEKGDYGSNYAITLSLKNNSSKDIKLIEGGVMFRDLLGAKLYSIKITPDLAIGAGKILTDKGSYRINQFINEQARMAAMKKSDISATIVINKLVFSDNTVGDYNP